MKSNKNMKQTWILIIVFCFKAALKFQQITNKCPNTSSLHKRRGYFKFIQYICEQLLKHLGEKCKSQGFFPPLFFRKRKRSDASVSSMFH